MRKRSHHLALDLGAESGRAIVGSLDNGTLTLVETHRFLNIPVRTSDGLHWDILRLWHEIQNGINLSAEKFSLTSLGIDTWGVDFALLDKHNALLGNPYHYRDERTDGIMERVFEYVPRAAIFAQTGIQFMPFNTLYQLFALAQTQSSWLDAAHSFLTIPDLFNFWLTGELTNEFTNATTTQCFNPITRDWAKPILATLNIPTEIFCPLIEPGAIINDLNASVFPFAKSAPRSIAVIAPACHDTGSAAAAVPAAEKDFAWISSGTWSILGVEANAPSVDDRALAYNFTNEGGVCGTWRLSKNIMGLWIIQECKREWNLSYDEITRLATDSRSFAAVIDPDDASFLHAGNMPEKIRAFCDRTHQAIPQTQGEIARVALESLALKYRFVLERLETLIGKKLSPIHIIGGGTKNKLLNQFTADCAQRPVIAGPVEATAIGNILMQAIGMKEIDQISDARTITRHSFPPEIYEPHHDDRWDAAYEILKSFSTQVAS